MAYVSPYLLVMKSDILTTQAFSIFGKGLVECAYLSAPIHFEHPAGEKFWIDALRTVTVNDSSYLVNEIDIGGSDIVIKFTNGRYVQFTASEWGSISAVSSVKDIDASP